MNIHTYIFTFGAIFCAHKKTFPNSSSKAKNKNIHIIEHTFCFRLALSYDFLTCRWVCVCVCVHDEKGACRKLFTYRRCAAATENGTFLGGFFTVLSNPYFCRRYSSFWLTAGGSGPFKKIRKWAFERLILKIALESFKGPVEKLFLAFLSAVLGYVEVFHKHLFYHSGFAFYFMVGKGCIGFTTDSGA